MWEGGPMGGWNLNFRSLTPEEEMAIDYASEYPWASYDQLTQMIYNNVIRVPHGVSRFRFVAMIRQKINQHLNPITE